MSESLGGCTQQQRIVNELRVENGVREDLAIEGFRWAIEWNRLIELHPDVNKVTFETARVASLDNCFNLTRCGNGRPLFQVEYAAVRSLERLSPGLATTYPDGFSAPGVRVIPHFDRLHEVVSRLIHTRRESIYPFNSSITELPQEEPNLPQRLKRGGREEAPFWFKSCYFMRGQIESVTAVRGLSKLYDARPDLFEPNSNDPAKAEVETLLRRYGLGSGSKGNASVWVDNMERLRDQCDGDPLALFEESLDYEDLKRKIMNTGKSGFKGFQEKMVSMLTYWYMSAGLVPYYPHPLPVDIHVTRISSSTGIVTYEHLPEDNNILSRQTLETLRRMFEDYSWTHGVNQLQVCDVMWAHGKAMCGDAVGNYALEPQGRFNRNGRSTELIREDITFDSAQMKRYLRTCGSCALQSVCKGSLPSKFYYLQGKLPMYERPESPQAELFNVHAYF